MFGTIDPTEYLGRFGFGADIGGGIGLFIYNIVNAVYIVAGLTFFVYLVIGGFKYLTAGGDVKQTQEATKGITQAVTGLAIVIGSYAITTILGSILGINIFQPKFKAP